MNRCFLSCWAAWYTLERAGRAGPALCPGRGAFGRVPLGPLPSLPRLRRPFRVGVRRVLRYYEAVRLPVLVHHRRASSDFAMRPWCAPRQARDLPVPTRDASARARGLRPRRVRGRLATTMVSMWPSALFHSVSTLEVKRISRLNTRPMRALSTLHRRPCGRAAHDSETMWFARPSSFGSLIRNISPVSTGARKML